MNRIDTTIQHVEDECLTFDVSDQALEDASGAEVNYTYYNCTGYGYCPGY
ncbi:MAG: hypothetical protein AB7V13_03485 [Pseudorhodoplanes sp.]